jgi:hypothetical protein
MGLYKNLKEVAQNQGLIFGRKMKAYFDSAGLLEKLGSLEVTAAPFLDQFHRLLTHITGQPGIPLRFQ